MSMVTETTNNMLVQLKTTTMTLTMVLLPTPTTTMNFAMPLQEMTMTFISMNILNYAFESPMPPSLPITAKVQ